LGHLLQASDYEVVGRATRVLHAFKSTFVDANRVLLTHPSAYVRWITIGELSMKSASMDVRPLIPALIASLEDKDTKVAAEAASQLGALQLAPDIVAPALIRALEDSRPDVRIAATFALGSFGPQASSALGALSRVLNDPSERVRMFAATAIKEINSNSVP